MKNQINPVVAGVVIAVLLILVGGVFIMKQRQQSAPEYSMVGADGKRHAPGAGGGSAAPANSAATGSGAVKPPTGAAVQ